MQFSRRGAIRMVQYAQVCIAVCAGALQYAQVQSAQVQCNMRMCSAVCAGAS